MCKSETNSGNIHRLTAIELLLVKVCNDFKVCKAIANSYSWINEVLYFNWDRFILKFAIAN